MACFYEWKHDIAQTREISSQDVHLDLITPYFTNILEQLDEKARNQFQS